MELSKQVCSLESARRLRQLGVKQESLFWWADYPSNEYGKLPDIKYGTMQELAGLHGQIDGKKGIDWNTYSAFTVAELGELLPSCVTTDKRALGMWCCEQRWTSRADFDGEHMFPEIHNSVFEKTEAEARAKMLIHILENKLVPL